MLQKNTARLANLLISRYFFCISTNKETFRNFFLKKLNFVIDDLIEILLYKEKL